jgi:hypothetical protein
VTPAPEDQVGKATEPLAKEPRVFRVDAAPTPPTVELLASSPATTEAAPHNAILAAHTPDQAVLPRIASDKRPGPVTHVFQALPGLLRELQAAAETPQLRLGVLMAQLQGVSPDLEMIAQAQAFSLVDESVAREWLRLSRQLDELHAKILAQMC